jgi:hypothetical protein
VAQKNLPASLRGWNCCYAAAPALADVSFDSDKLGAPAQNKEATDLPSSFFKTGT